MLEGVALLDFCICCSPEKDAVELQRLLLGDLEFAFGYAAHHAIVDILPFLRSIGSGEVEQGLRYFFSHDQRPHQDQQRQRQHFMDHDRPQSIQVIESCSTVANDTQMKYGP